MDVATTLDELAEQVAKNESVISCTDDEKRERVIESGRLLNRMKAEQKKEQQAAKEQGEEPVPWKDWVEAKKVASGNFPHYVTCNRYSVIAIYPDAYKLGMSVKQAYGQAQRWKANGGIDPGPTRVVPKAIPVAMQAVLGKCTAKLNGTLEEDWLGMARGDAEGWSDDAIAGFQEEISQCMEAVKRADAELRKTFMALVEEYNASPPRANHPQPAPTASGS